MRSKLIGNIHKYEKYQKYVGLIRKYCLGSGLESYDNLMYEYDSDVKCHCVFYDTTEICFALLIVLLVM